MEPKDIKIGQKYRVMPAFAGFQADEEKKQVGTVVWVHPKLRYAVLEFDGVDGRPREGFPVEELKQIVSGRRRKA